MNKTTAIRAILLGMMLLQGCDRSDGMLDDDRDMRPLIPERPPEIDPNIPRPPGDAQVMTTNANQIFDASGKPVLLRGINLRYDVNPSESLAGIAAIRSVGSNVVRLHLERDTTAEQLENALIQVVEQDYIAILVFTGPEGEVACTSAMAAIDNAVTNRWLNSWMPVLSQARFQSHIMLNIANAWGPVDIFSSAASQSYEGYIATYKEYIRRFRTMGFKVPLVIDAPGCGEDHHAFMGGRAQELLAADSQHNLVLSVHAFTTPWNSERKIRENTGDLQRLQMPFIVGSFGGSGAPGGATVDHDELMYMATGNRALTLNLPWSGPDDHVAMSYPLGEETDIIGLGATFEAFIPQSYIDAGGALSMQLLFENADGEYALTSPSPASSRFRNRWNRYAFVVSDDTDLVQRSESFDPSRVTRAGIRVSANGKAAAVTGNILIDHFTLSAVAAPIFFSSFDTDITGWDIPWGAYMSTASALTWLNGALAVLPDWNGADKTVPVRTNRISTSQPPLNLQESFTVSFKIFVPAEYATETSLSLQPFLQDGKNWVFSGLDFIPFREPEFRFDEWNTITVTQADFPNYILSDGYTGNDDFDVTVRPNALGIEIANVNFAKTSPILIDDVRVESSNVAATTERVTVYENRLENWRRGWGAGSDASLTYGDGVLSVLVPWTSSDHSIAMVDDTVANLPTPIDASEPFIVNFEIFIPEEYASESTMAIQPFVLDASSGTAFGSLAYTQVSNNIPLGQWFAMEIGIADLVRDGHNINPETFSVNGPLSGIGVEVASVTTAKTEPVQIRNFTVDTLVEVDQTVLALDFETAAEVTDFAFRDRGELSDINWLASFDDTVKTGSLGINPFGWIAWTWKSDDEESSHWSLSLSDGFTVPDDPDSGVDLTDRGEDVVNGIYGIFMSTLPAESAE